MSSGDFEEEFNQKFNDIAERVKPKRGFFD